MKNRNVVFMKDNMCVENDLEMCPSRKNEGMMMVVVDEFSKSSSWDDGEEPKEQVGDQLIAKAEKIKIHAENYCYVEKFSKDERYPKNEKHLPGEW